MPFYGDNNISDLGNAFQSMGGAIRNTAYQGANIRLRQQQMAQQAWYQQQQLQQQEALRRAQEQNLMAQAGYHGEQAAHQRAVDDAALRLGTAIRQRGIPPPLVLNEGAMADRQGRLDTEMQAAMGVVAGLHGNPSQAFPTASVGPGSALFNEATGQQMGYVPPVKRPYFAPAGSTPMNAEGQPTGPQTGFRPGSGLGQSGLLRFSPVAAMNAVAPVVEYGMQHPAMRDPTNSMYGQYSGATNIQALAQQAIQQGLGQANKVKRYRFNTQTGQLDPL